MTMPNTSWMLKSSHSPKSRILSIFSYLGVLCLVPLIFNRDDEYVNFHARQGLVLWIWGVLSIFSLHIPVIGAFFFSFSVLVIAIFAVIGIVSVLLTRAWKLPVVGVVASKL
jgi:fumarate reductase subunit D